MVSRDKRATKRIYIEQEGKNYLVDIYDKNGFNAIAEDIETRKIGRGHHETSEEIAITEAITNMK